MASTRSRPRGREHARPSAGGVAAEHATKIYTVAIIGIVVIVAFLALTSVGHVIDAATQHFMLYYAGVFALITLCASVGLGLVATDRMFMSPGHRVLVQSAHRAASFGAVAFLIIHIVTEILAQRVHVLDAVIPFLSPFRTFYIGLGTIASDLILLLLITGILRGRFNESGKAWRWRAIHYTSYLAFVFGVWHGLLGGRPGKPYVDWSYGFVVAFVLLGLAVRVLSNSLKPKENLSAPPVDMAANSASAPLRAAAMLAQYGGSRVGRTSILGASTGSQPVLSAPVSAQVLTALPAGGAGDRPRGSRTTSPATKGRHGTWARHGPREPAPCRGRPPGRCPGETRSAAARRHRADARAATGPMPRPGPARCRARHRADAAGQPGRCRALHRADARAPGTGPCRAPRCGPDAARGIRSHAARRDPGPCRGPRRVPMPRPGTGPYPASGRPGRTGLGERAVPGTARGAAGLDRSHAASRDRAAATGGRRPFWRLGDRAATQARRRDRPRRPRAARRDRASATADRTDGGQGPARTSGRRPGAEPATGAARDRAVPGNRDRPTGRPPGYPDGAGGGRPDRQDWQAAGYDGSWYPEEPQWDSGLPETDPNLRYREPGPGMPGYRGSREHRYGGDRY